MYAPGAPCLRSESSVDIPPRSPLPFAEREEEEGDLISYTYARTAVERLSALCRFMFGRLNVTNRLFPIRKCNRVTFYSDHLISRVFSIGQIYRRYAWLPRSLAAMKFPNS